MVSVDRIDHVVLTVRDLHAACDFYVRVLGMRAVTFEGGRKALEFVRDPDGNLVEVANTVAPTPGS